MVQKYDIEVALHAEHQDIAAGRLKEDSPLDTSPQFEALCEATRRGDLSECQQWIQEGVNINARDRFDYTPLILASLCGHFEVVQLLLEAGALSERDTFQGERAVYNALNHKIRDLLLSYDYTKSRDPMQPLASHITSLLSQNPTPRTSDIAIASHNETYHLHKFILAARSPYFAKKLAVSPNTTSWRVPGFIPTQSLEVAIRTLYLGESSMELSNDEEDQAVATGIEKLARQLEMPHLLDTVLEADRRRARQKRADEISRGRDQLDAWFRENILSRRFEIDADKVDSLQWDVQNDLFADVLLSADIEDSTTVAAGMIPVGPARQLKSVVYPAHKAMLLRSEYFSAMFSSPFREAQTSRFLPLIKMDCSPDSLAIVLTYLYTESANFNLDTALEVLFTADQLFIERLKVKAAVVISTLGNGATSVVESNNPRGNLQDGRQEDLIDIYDVVRAGWDTRVHRLEEFGARYIAYRLERFIDDPGFLQLVRESAARITARQETDTVELIDDIRYHLSQRFRLRFEDALFDTLEQDPAVDPADPKDDNDLGLVTRNDTDETSHEQQIEQQQPVIRTLDGEIAGDEFAQDTLNYQILLGKIDALLETLHLDA